MNPEYAGLGNVCERRPRRPGGLLQPIQAAFAAVAAITFTSLVRSVKCLKSLCLFFTTRSADPLSSKRGEGEGEEQEKTRTGTQTDRQGREKERVDSGEARVGVGGSLRAEQFTLRARRREEHLTRISFTFRSFSAVLCMCQFSSLVLVTSHLSADLTQFTSLMALLTVKRPCASSSSSECRCCVVHCIESVKQLAPLTQYGIIQHSLSACCHCIRMQGDEHHCRNLVVVYSYGLDIPVAETAVMDTAELQTRTQPNTGDGISVMMDIPIPHSGQSCNRLGVRLPDDLRDINIPAERGRLFYQSVAAFKLLSTMMMYRISP